RGLDLAFECLGSPGTVIQAFNMVRDGGRVVMVGIAPTGATAGIEITRLVRREVKLIGSYGARTRTDMPEILSLAEKGEIDLNHIVSREFTLQQVNEAYSTLAKGEIVGRAIVT